MATRNPLPWHTLVTLTALGYRLAVEALPVGSTPNVPGGLLAAVREKQREPRARARKALGDSWFVKSA